MGAVAAAEIEEAARVVAAVGGENEVGKADAAEGDGIKEHQGKTQLGLNPVFFGLQLRFLRGGFVLRCLPYQQHQPDLRELDINISAVALSQDGVVKSEMPHFFSTRA